MKQAGHEGHLSHETASIAAAIPLLDVTRSSLTRSLMCCGRVRRRLKSLFSTRVLIMPLSSDGLIGLERARHDPLDSFASPFDSSRHERSAAAVSGGRGPVPRR